MPRIAIIADVHGNLPALEAVIADVASRGTDRVVVLGDHVSGPLWPREAADLLVRQGWPCISGNCDRLVSREPVESLGASDRFARERLSEAQLGWLAGLPATLLIEEVVLAVHGTPADDSAYLLETVDHAGARLARQAEISDRLGDTTAEVVLCAHSHVPRVARVGERLIVNPGSVGLPAYCEDQPVAYEMETGSPDARYAIIERGANGWRTMLVAVPYDREGAIRRAQQAGRDDWVTSLRTGYARAPAGR